MLIMIFRNLVKKVQKVIEVTNSRCNYAVHRSALKEITPPCVPYLGMYLTELTFIEDGNKNLTVKSPRMLLITFIGRRKI